MERVRVRQCEGGYYAHLSGARNDTSFCLCEERSDEAISVGGNEIATLRSQ